MKNKLWLILLLSFPMTANALEVPKGGPKDHRVRYINYDPSEVVKITAHYGWSTHIQFADEESIKDPGIAMGDENAWTIAPIGNHLFLKPKEDQAGTNMTVLTSHRTYNFELLAHESQSGSKTDDMMFQVVFRYPEVEQAIALAKEESKHLRDLMNDKDVIVSKNMNYWIMGSEDISPSKTFDDGRFTRITFPPGNDKPAIFIENEDGTESLVNRHVEGDTIVVHKVSRKLILRKGNQVACLVNKSYGLAGRGTPTGSTDPDVVRVIKGAK